MSVSEYSSDELSNGYTGIDWQISQVRTDRHLCKFYLSIQKAVLCTSYYLPGFFYQRV